MREVQQVLNRLQLFTIFSYVGGKQQFFFAPLIKFSGINISYAEEIVATKIFRNISWRPFVREYFLARIWVDIPSCGESMLHLRPWIRAWKQWQVLRPAFPSLQIRHATVFCRDKGLTDNELGFQATWEEVELKLQEIVENNNLPIPKASDASAFMSSWNRPYILRI